MIPQATIGPTGDYRSHRRLQTAFEASKNFSPEEERLALAGDSADDLLDLGLKAHVKHAICLIQHEVADLPQADLARLQEVIKTARCGNADVDAIL